MLRPEILPAERFGLPGGELDRGPAIGAER
jgi:hypothetical protein